MLGRGRNRPIDLPRKLRSIYALNYQGPGASPYFERTATMNMVDSKKITISLWIKLNASSRQYMFWDGVDNYWLDKSLFGGMVVDFHNAANTVVAHMQTGTWFAGYDRDYVFLPDNGLMHFCACIDTDQASKCNIFVNGVEFGMPGEKTIVNSATIDFTKSLLRVGGGLQPFGGMLSQVYFAPGVFIDLNVEANMRKFLSEDGYPMELGADGSLPAGEQPAIFWPTGDPRKNHGYSPSSGWTLNNSFDSETPVELAGGLGA